MLSRPACLLQALLWLVVSSSSFGAVAGAFGLEFATPVPRTMLAASVQPGFADSLLAAPADDQQDLPYWYTFHPPSVPTKLKSLPSEYYLLLDLEQRPSWLLGLFNTDNCGTTLRWLQGVLDKKYAQQSSIIPLALPQTGTTKGELLRFSAKQVEVAAGCLGNRLQLEYRHRGQIQTLAAQHARQLQDSERQPGLAAAADHIGRLRGRAVAANIIGGNQFAIEQIFGWYLAEPIKVPGNFDPDEPIPLRLQGVPPPFQGRSATAQLSPSGHLIRLEISIDDVQAKHQQALRSALRRQFTAPTKDTDNHIIFKVSEDYITLRSNEGKLKLHAVVGSRARAQKARLAAQQEAQWQADNAGI